MVHIKFVYGSGLTLVHNGLQPLKGIKMEISYKIRFFFFLLPSIHSSLKQHAPSWFEGSKTQAALDFVLQ